MILKEPENKTNHTEHDEHEDDDKGAVTERVLRGLGKIAPGLGDLVNGLAKSKAFQERLNEADAEIERQLKNAPPLKTVKSNRKSIIPPKTTLNISRTFTENEAMASPAPKDVIVDIFDEGDYIKVVAELFVVNEQDITLELQNNSLILAVRTVARTFSQEISLPCPVQKIQNSIFKNGILQVTLEKKRG